MKNIKNREMESEKIVREQYKKWVTNDDIECYNYIQTTTKLYQN